MNKLKSIFHINKKNINRRNNNHHNDTSIEQGIIPNRTGNNNNNNNNSNNNNSNSNNREGNEMGVPTRKKLEQLSLNDDNNNNKKKKKNHAGIITSTNTNTSNKDMTLEDRCHELFHGNDNDNDNDNDKLGDKTETRHSNTGSSFDANISLSSIDSVSSVSASLSCSFASSSLSLLNNGRDPTQFGEDMNLNSPIFAEQAELNDYKLLSKIGEGAFSKVFRGISLSTGENVAIKVIRKETLSMISEDSGATTATTNNNRGRGQAKKKSRTKLEQVLKEVALHKMVTSLQCENIVKFIEFKETPSFYYIVQELLTGGEIFNSIVKYTYFSEDLSRHVIKQLGNAVKALHSIGVVHRDIKPENLLFNPIEYIPRDKPRLRKSDDPLTKLDEGVFRPGIGGGGIGVVKLTDFGLSKQIYQTNTKTPCGTVGYAAPEVVKDERYSMKVDMWGVGCVLYTMLCGFPPFYDDRIDVLTEKIAKGEYTFLQPWWDEISDGAKNCVARLLEVDPHKRYNIEQFLNDPWLNRYDTEANTTKVTNSNNNGKGVKNKNKIHHQFKQAHMFQEDPSILYSPAAVAMRDAFDISNAVKRNGIDRANNKRKELYSLDEKMEIENEDDSTGNNYHNSGTSMNSINNDIDTFKPSNVFELNLNTSTIIQRRQRKQRMTVSNNNNNNNNTGKYVH